MHTLIDISHEFFLVQVDIDILMTLPLQMRRNLSIEPDAEVAFEQAEEGILVMIKKGGERGRQYSLEELLEGVREKRGELLKGKYGIDDEDD